MLYYKKDKYTFTLPDWSTVKQLGEVNRVYSIFDKNVLVCYASIGTFFYEYSNQENKYQSIWIINVLETNPKYRRKGYAQKILTTIFDDYPDNHFVIEPTKDLNVHKLYAKMGFSLLYYDGGYDVYTLLKLAKNTKHDFDEISNVMSENDSIEPCFFFDYSGVKWDNNKKVYPGEEPDEEEEDSD